MILIRCENFKQAYAAFNDFVVLILDICPKSVKKIYEYALCLENEDGARYIFIDDQYYDIFEEFELDGVYWVDEFFSYFNYSDCYI